MRRRGGRLLDRTPQAATVFTAFSPTVFGAVRTSNVRIPVKMNTQMGEMNSLLSAMTSWPPSTPW